MTRSDSGGMVVGSIVDMGGVLRAKVVPASRLDSFVRSGMGAAPVWNTFCVDNSIAFTDSVTVVGDMRLRIDAGSLRNLGGGTVWAPGALFDQNGAPAPGCARDALQRVTDHLAGDGLAALVGHEIEFMLFPEDGPTPDDWNCYGLSGVFDREGFIRDLLASAAIASLPIEQFHAEYGAHQFEISLAPETPVHAADNAVLARILIGRAARSHGLRASFSPVPIAGGGGNGAHQHVSFTRGGNPVFGGGAGPHGLTPEGENAIAGIVAGLPEFMAIFASSALSHLRLQPGMWSGAYQCWGLENREAAVRYCAATQGNPHGASVEVKVIDSSANPYLSTAAIIGMARSGMSAGTSLPPEVTVDPSTLGNQALIPSDAHTMLDLLEKSATAESIFGAELISGFLAVKRYENKQFGDEAAGDVADRLRYAWSV